MKPAIQDITSPHNPKFKSWLSLLEAKGIRQEGLALVSGSKLVNEILSLRPADVEDLLLPPKTDWSGGEGHRRTRLNAELFKKLDVIGTRSVLAVVRTPKLEAWRPEPPRGLELVLALSDPSNLGACLRSAEAFGARRVILASECASPFLPKAVRASSLSAFRLPMVTCGALADLKAESLFGLDMEGENLFRFEWPENLYLVLGEEGRGLPANLKPKRLRIPMQPSVESLNATVAASVALASYRTRFPLA